MTEQVQDDRLKRGCPLGISPSNPGVMLAHGRTGLILSRDAGKTWSSVDSSADLEKPARLEGYGENLAATNAQGTSAHRKWLFEWTRLIVTQIVFPTESSDVAFLVTNKGPYRTNDGAHNWCLLDTGPHQLFDVCHIYLETYQAHGVFVGTNRKVLIADDLGCHFRTFVDSELYVHGNSRP